MRSGTAQALGMQYLFWPATLPSSSVVSESSAAKVGSTAGRPELSQSTFLNTGLVFNVTPAYQAQLHLGSLLIIVIMFHTLSRHFSAWQRRKAMLFAVGDGKIVLLQRTQLALSAQLG
ncbi:MAG: hypothetical protein GY798_22865 [Hyphomicrobiales bacterium]|nr:hypothetical protein [Hyphomicrobiales bacterium]